MKTLIVTACGAKKHSEPMVAYKIYRSSRIKAVYNRCQGFDMAILSAKYGLVDAHEVIEPYDVIMDEQIGNKLVSRIIEKIKKYDRIIFYKGGSNKHYFNCLKNACTLTKKNFISIGYSNMGDINELPKILGRSIESRRYIFKCANLS